MSESSSPDPWSSLADKLGVDPSASPQAAPPPTVPEAPPAPQPPRSKSTAAPSGRRTANWGDIAGQLGIEVPPEPEPAAAPVSKPGVAPIESLVRGTEAPGAKRGERPEPERSEADESGRDDRPPRQGQRGEREHTHERGRGREEGRGRGRDDRGGRPARRDDRGRRGREQARPARGERSERGRGEQGRGERAHDTTRGEREGRGRAVRDEYDQRRRERDDDPRQVGDDHSRSSEMPADDQVSPFDLPPLELEGSGRDSDEREMDLAEETADADFSSGGLADEQDGVRDGGEMEGTGAPRRRRRRRGRRVVLREDAFLGIDRLATEDIVNRETPADEHQHSDDVEDRDDALFGEEISAIEIGGDEANGNTTESAESDVQRRRRRRRRRGRGTRDRSGGSARADSADDEERDDEERDEAEPLSDQRTHRAGIDDEDSHGLDEDDDEEFVSQGESARPSKNLHRDVTPWSEAIGFIVSTNMEARAKSPAGGGGRGRWNKGDRRS